MIDGAAVFVENGAVANLSYTIECGPDWSTQQARVTGWIGEKSVDVECTRNGPDWHVSGVPVVGNIGGISDIDLGFTPATNTNAIRRLNLAVGEMAEATALWLDVDNWSIKPLRQTYRRVDEARYEYASPDHGFSAVLEVNGAGLVTNYPDLWVAQDR